MPSLGKTYGSAAAVAKIKHPVTFLTSRYELRDDFADIVRKNSPDASIKKLPSFHRDCPTAIGEYDSEVNWSGKVHEWYSRGATPGKIHAHAEHTFGEPLPCQRDRTCPYSDGWDFDPEDYDVLVGHYTHAYRAEKVATGRVVVIDEFPEETYIIALGSAQLREAVNDYLARNDRIPFDDLGDLLERRVTDPAARGKGLLYFDEYGVEPDESAAFDSTSWGHAYAPLAVYVLLRGAEDKNRLGNGFESVALPSGNMTAAYDRKSGEMRFLSRPSLTYARNIVALDGTPTRELWELVLGIRLRHERVLSDDERRDVLDDMGYRFIQTTDGVKPYSSGWWVNTDYDGALFRQLYAEHGGKLDLITSQRAIEGVNKNDPERETPVSYREAGLLDGDGPVGEHRHYGDLKGSNVFKSSRRGVVSGSPHYGDKYVQWWGALAGKTVKRAEDGTGSVYGPFGDKVLHHFRENEVAQAALRFGRDGRGAVVYLNTSAIPEWIPLYKSGRLLALRSEGERQVIAALRELGSGRTADITEHDIVDLSPQQIRNHLNQLVERGFVRRGKDPEDRRAVRWEDVGLEKIPDAQSVAREAERAAQSDGTLTPSDVYALADPFSVDRGDGIMTNGGIS